MLFIKVNRYRLEKAKKSPHLVPEKRSITRAGKTFMMTVWVDPADKKKGKGKKSRVEDKTPNQMSLFDMGEVSKKPVTHRTIKNGDKLIIDNKDYSVHVKGDSVKVKDESGSLIWGRLSGVGDLTIPKLEDKIKETISGNVFGNDNTSFQYKTNGKELLYKNPNADWKQLAFLSSPEKALEYQKLVEAHDKSGGQGSARSIVDPDLQRMVSTIQAEKEADGYFATNPKGETEAEERAMAGYEVNGAKKQSKQATGKPKEKPEMSAGLDRIMNKPLDGLALRQLNKIIAEGKLEENVPDAKENMPMIMARIAEQEAKYKARSEELDKREEERAKRRQAEKDRVKNPAIIKDTDLKTPEEIKNRIVSITRQWNKINDLIETPSRKKQREKLSERKEYLEKKLKDQGMKKSIFSFAKNWIQGNR